MSARLARLAPYLVVGLGAAWLYYIAAHMQYERRAGTLGPDFWPKLVLGLTIAVCVIEAARIALERAGGKIIEKPRSTGDDEAETPPQRPVLVVSGMALTALYAWLLHVMGFFSATVPYVAAFVVLGGYRRWGVVAAVSIVGALVMMFFFMKVVYVSLPLGDGPFQAITLLLMRVMGIR